ncbi:MAG: hypothetical protein HGA38_01670 [Candidatus Moranbacteria bacterium]|nr:hypothetical protein [Candidatus Moranbacteria bacterium]
MKRSYRPISRPRTEAKDPRGRFTTFVDRYSAEIVMLVLTAVSVSAFAYYYANGLGVAYNDARSHLDIGRRVVEGLNPGAAQLGSVWLPLTHALMGLTIWNDFMWHSGLAGALWSMIAFVGTGVLIDRYLKEVGVGLLGRFTGVGIFAANLNTLYLQSTAMTELMLLGTMTAGCYFFLLWYKRRKILHLVAAAFFIALSTLVRYDGWFLLFMAAAILFLSTWREGGYRKAEGLFILFSTLGGFGVALWVLWNALIFKDPLYFAFGPYSAHAQQDQLESAGVLPTKWHWLPSIKVYFYALAYNSGAFTMILGLVGQVTMWLDRRLSREVRTASALLVAPLLFNVLALYLGHSVLYIQGLSGDTWFNVRYGIMMLPSFAIAIGYLTDRLRGLRFTLVGLLLFTTFFMFSSGDAVTIDDARVGSSQKNVSEVSGWLHANAGPKKGFILISAASHDSVIFSSGLPMSRFIHEGTGKYYDAAIESPDHWARWIVVRSYSDDDSTWRQLKDNEGFLERFEKVDSYPFADIYELRPEFVSGLVTDPIFADNPGSER